MMIRGFQVVLSAVLALMLMTSYTAMADTKHDARLYEALGGQSGIHAIMETFVLNIAEDERVVHHFVNADVERFHAKISEHICELTGGPCVYSGAAMPEVHKGMNISRAEFNAIVENLIKAMETHHVRVDTQNQLLAILAAMHNDVIQR